MKKFKIFWVEIVRDEMNDVIGRREQSQIIEAADEDAACDAWEAEHEHDDNHNGIVDCQEVVEHDLLGQMLLIDMPNGLTYGIKVETIARDRAKHYAHPKFDGDLTRSLLEDTLPLFAQDNAEIEKWAKQNMSWSTVQKHSIVLEKRITKEQMQEAWLNAKCEMLQNVKTKSIA